MRKCIKRIESNARAHGQFAVPDCHFLSSVGGCLYLDDVGIEARAVAVVGAYPIVIERIGGEPGHVSAGCIAYIQILISWYVSAKRIACGDVQFVTRRTANTRPVRSEA